MADERIIVALDVRTLAEAKALVDQLGDSIIFYKVGMELFYAVGPQIITYLKSKKKKIFLDLKLHDIPNTVAEGLISLMKLGVDIFNVHASGGFTMLNRAAQRVKEEAAKMGIEPPKLIAITVLTSVNADDWAKLGMQMPLEEQVVRLAKMVKEAGLDGVVASPKEAAKIRQACGKDFMIVTPGVRPAGASADDQSRIATPAQALRNGASQLVIGRPIYKADDPRAAAKKILAEIAVVD
ncbi:orotidine-5'-phosphate decarboxylase [Pectinatus cerevisiiphilus]|uniref:Orotidine 5'-phosphate decarboxylase n=1 Tax=Pectinatus cerevisiiphilus TaxID=86956 RepID=A0A4R3KAD5_9FIRM|nr:orotidine-5'-phosphate decarboxylase [Pectinatus cerevisiiphilus]TCS80056.1 orotidine-5'-phosphate decarboxylase [Pectinatus cerevisiiphilus]